MLITWWFSASVCLAEILLVKPDDARFIVAQATRDSVFAGNYYPNLGNLQRTPAYPGQRPHAVYGQLFRLLDAQGSSGPTLIRHRTIVIIWWRFGSACTWFPPAGAIRFPVEDLFALVDPRPEAEWIGGLPTFDLLPKHWMYSTAPEIGVPLQEAARMRTVTEYAEWFDRLPPGPVRPF